jgi:hypothetical protein
MYQKGDTLPGHMTVAQAKTGNWGMSQIQKWFPGFVLEAIRRKWFSLRDFLGPNFFMSPKNCSHPHLSFSEDSLW